VYEVDLWLDSDRNSTLALRTAVLGIELSVSQFVSTQAPLRPCKRLEDLNG